MIYHWYVISEMEQVDADLKDSLGVLYQAVTDITVNMASVVLQ